ncbi:MAG: LytR C-terminal domain-containing protein [Gaiellaceae bacterium]
MEHSLPSPVSVGPWRTATIVVLILALLELAALVAAGAALFGPSVAHTVQHAAAQQVFAPIKAVPLKHQPKPGPPALSRAQTSILVLNGNGRAGAAAAAAKQVRRRGYTVDGAANAPHVGYVRSIVMFRPGLRAEALRFARDLHVRIVSPLDGIRPVQLHGAKLAYVLGSS